jgi:dienelactone hydrolase
MAARGRANEANMTTLDALADYARFDFTDPAGRWTRPVWRRGTGPAVIVIHEMPGLHPLVIRFADRVAAAGMTVFCPSLFGEPGRPVSAGYAIGTMLKAICISREFDVWATDRSSPIVDWLRALAAKAHAECGGRGVGAVGMCFTGNFALAMMTEPAVVAPVLSQPSLPLPIGSKRRGAGIGVSPAEIACAKRRLTDEDLSVLALRFFGDQIVPDARFDSLKAAFGDRIEAIEIDPKDARPDPRMAPHSVLTVHLRDDDPDGPTKKAEQRVIAFFKERTAGSPPAP